MFSTVVAEAEWDPDTHQFLNDNFSDTILTF